MPTNPPKRRGAPIGNTNTLKHGFYAKKFKAAQIKNAGNLAATSLDEEAALMRLLIQRTCEKLDDTNSLEEHISLLRGVSLAFISLTRIMRANVLLNPADDGVGAALSQALAEALAEMEAKRAAKAARESAGPPEMLAFPPAN